MNYNYSKSNFINKLDKIVEARYKTEKADTDHKQYRAFYSAYREKYFDDDFDIGANVRLWRSCSNDQLPRIKILMKLCSLLDCDIDYFITEQNDFRKDLAAAAETTGLRYDTLDRIEAYPPEVKQLIDRLVLHKNKDNLLKLLNAILTYSLHSHHAYVKIDVPGADMLETNDIEEKLVNYSPANPLDDISKKMLKYSVTSSLDELLTDTYNDYVDDGNSLLWERLKKRGEYEKAAVKNAFEKRKTTCELTVEDIRLICGNRINNDNPTLDERYNQIDEKISHVYELYKESSKNSK